MRARLILPLPLLGYPALATAQTYLPDHHHTPDSTNPEVTQENLHSTICSRGYTK